MRNDIKIIWEVKNSLSFLSCTPPFISCLFHVVLCLNMLSYYNVQTHHCDAQVELKLDP